MSIHVLREMTWSEVDSVVGERTVALLPIGAIEAHGPHLPLDTDGIIAASMVDAAAVELAAQGQESVILPQIDYSPAQFAGAFAGTVSIGSNVLTELIANIAGNVARWEVPVLGIANAHLDPDHLRSLHAAVEAIHQEGTIRVAFPDLTRRPWGSRLTEEFKSGACHAGRFESSIVLAAARGRVREQVRLGLAPNPRSLSDAIAEGITSFADAGGPEAYFGDPAAASLTEGIETIRILGAILCEAVLEELESRRT